MNCLSCNEKIIEEEVECTLCKGKYHFKCSIEESYYRRKSTSWKCKLCIEMVSKNAEEENPSDDDQEETCRKCNEIFVDKNPDKMVVCHHCKNVYHNKCCGVAQSTQHGRSAKEKKNWKCPTVCRQENGNRSRANSQTSINEAVTKKDLDELSEKIIEALNGKYSQLEKKIDGVHNAQIELLERIEKLELDNGSLVADIVLLQEREEKLENTVQQQNEALAEIRKEILLLQDKLEDKITELEKKKDNETMVDQSEKSKSSNEKNHLDEEESWKRECALIRQYTRKENLEIHNVPIVKDENLKVVALKILKLIMDSLIEEDIQVAHRIAKRKNDKIPGIIVRMKDREKKFEIMMNKKEKVITQDIILGNGCGELIFVNDNIDQYFLNLLLLTRKIVKKQFNWKYVWFSNGSIFVKKDDKGEKIKIRDEKDLRQKFKVMEKDNVVLEKEAVGDSVLVKLD